MHSTWRKNTCKVIQTLTTTLIDPYSPLTPFMHTSWGRNTRKVTQPLTNIPVGLLVQIPGCMLTQSSFYNIGMCKYQHQHCQPLQCSTVSLMYTPCWCLLRLVVLVSTLPNITQFQSSLFFCDPACGFLGVTSVVGLMVLLSHIPNYVCLQPSLSSC